MFLRRAAAALHRRIPFPSQTVAASRYAKIANASSASLSSKMEHLNQYGSEGYTWRGHHKDIWLWIFISGHSALVLGLNGQPVLAEDVSIELSSENYIGGANATGLRRVEDGSVISNMHTSKWRIFTDQGRELFLQGKLEEAENFFLSALQEAKEGFGAKDPHVASSCNNLETLRCSMKIKRRVLGDGHTDYADTMYHLGMVLYLQGKIKDSEALIQDSVRILEAGGLGESTIFIRRLRYLAQIYLKSNQPAEAENAHRKILHIMEFSKGWNSLDTVIAAEDLALTLQSVGRLREAQELLQRCLDVRKSLLPEDHIQISANLLHMARVKLLSSGQLKKKDAYEAISELDKAKDLLGNSIRIAQHVVDKLKEKGNLKNHRASGETEKERQAALVILLQSLDTLGLLEITKHELLESRGEHQPFLEAENVLRQCISAFKELPPEGSISKSAAVKVEYLSCLKHLSSLISDSSNRMQQSTTTTLQELNEEIKRVKIELSQDRKSKNQSSS
ncbi:hypothetical protein PVL29_018498 [Vitis rotundifolia]|uniref:Kinesin light chain n=1 Tax=Vitis rotundifolia TaxID=103349 RepID=A0AA38Z620_VITRO|nr:hypothetical protein PVL29_018498 [Vitis rotundifolia]